MNLKNSKVKFLLFFLSFVFIFFFIFVFNIIKVTSRIAVGDIEKGLIGHWPLNGTYDTKDITPYGRNGVSYGAILSTGIKGEGNGSYSFGTTSNSYYISLPNISQIKDQSICMWLYPTNIAGGRQNPYNQVYGGDGTITQETSGSLTYYYGTSGANTTPYQGFATSGYPLSNKNNTWTHICLIRDLTNMRLYWYINGTLNSTATASYSSAKAGGVPILIGKGYAGNYSGSIYDLRLYNRALSSSEIRSLYELYKPSLGASSVNKGLIAHYLLNEEYSTEGTTNLWGNTNGRPASLNSGGTTPPTVELISQNTPFGTQVYKVTIPANNATGYSGCRVTGPSATMYYDGRPYSYYTYVSGDLSGVSIYPTGSRGQASCSYDSSKDKDQWKYYVKEKTTDTTGGSGKLYMTWYASTTSTSARVFYISATQIEQKDHSTPFVNGTRNYIVEDKSGGMNGVGYGVSFGYGRKGESNGATYFTGAIDSYVILPISVVNGLGDYTVSFWVKSTDTSKSLNEIIHGTKTGGNTLSIEFRNSLIYNIINDTYYSFSTNIHNNNQWYHVVATREGSTCKVYEDNVLKGTNNCTNAVINISGGALVLGQEQDSVGGTFDATQSLSGYLADMRIYNRALSALEIENIYDSYKPKLSTGSLNKGLILNAPLNSSYMQNSTTVSDNTPYGNHGNVYNGTVISDDCATFDGVDDYINLNSIDNELNPNQGSISVWAKKTGNVYYIISSNLNYRTYITVSSSAFNFIKGNPSVGISSPSVSNNVWYHLVLTWDTSQTMRAYINGTLISSKVFSSTDNSSRFTLGSFNGAVEYFSGSISNLRVYNRVLSDEEVKLLYDKGRN